MSPGLGVPSQQRGPGAWDRAPDNGPVLGNVPKLRAGEHGPARSGVGLEGGAVSGPRKRV